MRRLIKKIILFSLRLYRNYFSYYLPASCRFYPSCSQYAAEAIEVHGATKGIWLTAVRLSCCHPLHKGGFDPVPIKTTEHKNICAQTHPQPTPEIFVEKL